MSTDTSTLIAPPRRGGRPRVTEPRSTVCTWVPAKTHDRLITLAKQRGVSVSAVVRALVTVRLPEK